jgi:L-alanine-DL-glutamate epimerase-like enolase superfamily enzyme
VRIERITATPFRIPLTTPQVFASGTLTAAEHVLVQAYTSDGVRGVSEALPRPMVYGETTASVLNAIETLIAPAVVGIDAARYGRIPGLLRGLVGNVAAKSAVELAVVDAYCRTLGVPAWQFLGGASDRVRVTAIVHETSTPEMVARAVRSREVFGVSHFKIKVGRDLDGDIRTVRAIRHELGAQATLYCDANCGYSEDEAIQFANAVSDFGVTCIEEPCSIGNPLGRQRVAQRSPIPILGDESCPDPGSVAREVLAGTCSLVSIKVARTAVVGSETIRGFCAATGTGVIIGSQGDSAIGMLTNAAMAAARPETCVRPAELLFFAELSDNLTIAPPAVCDGVFSLPSGPGFGVELDDDKVAFYSHH